jgi:tetratricopeptide (TPR) repeat protein
MAARIPGARFVELPGADHFPGVDSDQILDEVEPFVAELAGAPPAPPERGFATVVVADGGEAPVVSLFDGPARAVRSGLSLVRGEGAARRAGVHTGEVERRDGRPGGPAVDVARRVAAVAAPGEVLVTATTRDLVPGSGLSFEDRGERRLGESGPRRLYAAGEGGGGAGGRADAPAGEARARPLAATAFVGREDETARLTAALDAAAGGDGRLVMLSGEPGIGKSRTAAELGAPARARGARVLWGRCHEREGAPPYLPWIQVLRELVRDSPADEAAADMGTGAAEIASLVPELRGRLPDLGEPAGGGDPEQARFRLLDAVAGFLVASSARRPLVVVLEDLHAADTGSLALLELVARALGGSRLLVVGTYRDGEVPAGHPLAATLAELSGEGPVERIALRGLAREEVARVIASASGTAPGAGLAEAAWSRTEGNPLFLLELVRLLAQEGALDEAAEWPRGLPEGVRAVIARRLARLSDPCNEVLRLAAVSGRRFGLPALAAVRGEGGEDEVLEALEEALAARVVEEEPGAPGRYLFSHALIRETLLEELSAVRRARLHARMGAALEELHGAAAGAHAAELLHHFAEAAPVLGPEPVVRYGALAGEAALAARAYDEAAARFRQALAARGDAPMDETAARLHFGLGRALLATRELPELDEAVTSLQLAFDHHVERGDAAGAIAIACHPLTPHLMYEPTGVSRLVARALELAPPDSPEAARLLSTYGWLTGINRADADAAQEAFDRAVAIARSVADPVLEVRALVNAQYVQMFHMRWDESRRSGLRAVELAVPAGDRRSEAAARGWLARAVAREGDLATARREVAAATPHAEALRELYWRATSGLHNAMTAAFEGDWARAREWGDAGLAVRRRDPRNLGLRALVEHETGELTAGSALLDRLRAAVDAVPPPGPGAEHPFATAFAALCDHVADSDDHLDLVERAGEGVLAMAHPLPYLSALASIGLGLAAVRRGDAAAAGRHLDALTPYAGTAFVLPPLVADRLLGILALAAGRREEGIARLEAAHAFAERAGYRPESAWASFELASALRDGAGDREAAAAEAHRAAALRIARGLGMNALLGRLAVAA